MVGGVVKLEGRLDETINESDTANNQSEEKVITTIPEEMCIRDRYQLNTRTER